MVKIRIEKYDMKVHHLSYFLECTATLSKTVQAKPC